MKYMYILSKKHWYIKQTMSLAIKSVVSCYIKSLQVLFTRLVKSTNLMGILSNDSDDRIDLARGEEQNREEGEMAQKKLGGGRNKGEK